MTDPHRPVRSAALGELGELGNTKGNRVSDTTHNRAEVLTDAEIAQQFHETYEALAPSFGYETRAESRKPWADVPEQNKQLMIAVCGKVRALLAQAAESAQQAPTTRTEPVACPNCAGTGEVTGMSDNSPDAHEISDVCPHCEGHQTLQAAYVGALKLLKAEQSKYLKACSEIWAQHNGLAAPPAPSASGPDYEHRRAIMEGERNAAADDYFKARWEGLDTIHNRRIFEAGFERGYSAAPVAAPQQEPVAHVVDIDRNHNESIIDCALPTGTPLYLAQAAPVAAQPQAGTIAHTRIPGMSPIGDVFAHATKPQEAGQAAKMRATLYAIAHTLDDHELRQAAKEAYEAAQAAPAVRQPELTVWYGPMPESNGKSNFTAILMRKGGDFTDGITIDRSEYPDRVRYEGDRVRYLIGELAERPFILDYDADKHSGYAPSAPAQEKNNG